jgi:hypothetical protein
LPENIHCASCSYGQNKKILHTREFPIWIAPLEAEQERETYRGISTVRRARGTEQEEVTYRGISTVYRAA